MDEFRHRAERDPDIFHEAGTGLPGPFGLLAFLLAAAAWGAVIAWWLS